MTFYIYVYIYIIRLVSQLRLLLLTLEASPNISFVATTGYDGLRVNSQANMSVAFFRVPASSFLDNSEVFPSAASRHDQQAARQQAMYDMVYVERLPEEQQMTSGLFLPTKENPRMHVCKVCFKVASNTNGIQLEGHLHSNSTLSF